MLRTALACYLFFLYLRYIRLFSIPGPFLAKFTDLWRWFIQNYSVYDVHLTELHRKYGKIVRIGPSMVSISDPEAITQVYGVNPALEKVRTINALRKRQTLITAPRVLRTV